MILTVQAALALALQCAPGVDPATIVGIAKAESGLDTASRHLNSNGSTDWGLMQINTSNFGWLGLTVESSLDPCRSMAAGAAVLRAMSAYNTGSPTRGGAYALRVMQAVRAVKSADPIAAPVPPQYHSPFTAPGKTAWDVVYRTGAKQ